MYSYDDFNNIDTETICILKSEFDALEKEYDSLEKKYEYDCFNRITCIKESWIGELKNGSAKELIERTFSYEYSPYSEKLLQTKIYVNNKLMGERKYDRFERLEEEQVGANSPRKYQYNNGSFKPKQMETPRGEHIKFQYAKELNNKPTSVSVEGKHMRYLYEYDPNTSLVTKQVNNSTIREITYDCNRNISNERLEINKHEYNNAYVYAEFGTLKLIEKMSGEQIEYRYNTRGQVIGFIEGDLEVEMTYTNDFPLEIRMTGEENEDFISKFTYDAMGREVKREFLCKQDSEQDLKPMGHISVGYNNAGKISFKEIDFDGENVQCKYQYDIFGKIILAEMEGTSYPEDMFGNEITKLEYSYDVFDNIECVTTSYLNDDPRTATFIYDEDSPCKLIKVKNLTFKDEEIDIEYDKAGNIIFDGKKDYTYDPFEKLVSTAASAEDLSIYTDDFVGRKYMQNCTQTKTATTTFYDKDNKLIRSITNNEDTEKDVETMDFIEINDQISYIKSEKDGKRAQYGLLNDMNGSNYGWVNMNDCKEKGNLRVYTPYGFTNMNDQIPIQFAGEPFDSHSGLYHLGNRAYSPLLMRFLQQDEASPFDEGGPNPYLYPGDPISFTDPNGNISTWAAVGIGLGVAGLLFSAFTFGLGAVAVGGVLAFVKTTAGVLAATSLVLETASLATGIAAAVTEESDPETSRQLSVASGILGLGSFVTGIGATIKSAPSLIGKFKAENMISGAVDSVDFIGTTNGGKTMKYLFSANYKGGSLLVTHGVPSEKLIKSFNGLSVTGQRIAPELRELYRISTLAGEATGPLYLRSCGAAKLGRASNAQKIATALNREVVVFPNRYTWSLKGLSPISAGDTLSFVGWGWPPFSKFLTLTP
ncbi:RHS repeat-associated core domain-containing protein [Bacillus cereus group sp. BfR-BA-01349]|uniref:RHS repeat-associated core domain-containing protein n=1 Tax=Bacillus cereus group sp. BfR-BA-01349 TaxID=2920312 RepID=UPI001F59E75A